MPKPDDSTTRARHDSTSCEIIAIGNELLIGEVQDTNTHWLIQQLTGLGGQVRRCFIVRDEFPAIGEAVRASIEDLTGLIVTTGGLGPTSDDLTLAAVAAALNLPLVEHAEALAMLTNRYEELARVGWVVSAQMNQARRKMAQFPQGARPMYNPVGGAPAALLRLESSTLVCLPGVPSELQSIFAESLQPLLAEYFGGATFRRASVIVDCQDESFLAETLQTVVSRHPRVYIKSRAKRFGPNVRIRVTLSTTGSDATSADVLLGSALADLQETLGSLGLNCLLEPDDATAR